MDMRKVEPRYLGDGVYATFDGYHIWLLVGSHDQPTAKVALEIDVYEALTKYASKCGFDVAKGQEDR